MALGPMALDQNVEFKTVKYTNASAASVTTSGANITVTQVGSDDLTGYTLIGLIDWALLGSGTDKLTLRGYDVHSNTKQLYVNNLGSSTVNLAAGYVEVYLKYAKTSS